MKRFDCLVYFFLLGLFCIFVACDGLSNGSSKGQSIYKSGSQKSIYNGLGMANGDHQMRGYSAAKPKEQSKARQGLGLSAWGIIGVLTASLLLGAVLYYALLFYPILCKKERKNNNEMLDVHPTAPPAVDTCPALSTPV